MRATTTAAVCSFVFLVLGASAPATGSDLRVGPVFKERFPTVEVVIEPRASGGLGASLPSATDLTLIEDGLLSVHAQSVRPFGQTGHGLSVVVAVDVSGTMAGAPIEETRRALRSLLQSRGPRDQVALVSFADDVRTEAPLGASPGQLRAAVEGLAPRGQITELYRALFKSISLLPPEVGGQRRLIVISDGKDEGAAYQLDDVVDRARNQGIPIDAIGLTRIDPKYLSILERMAELSGGHYSRAGSATELESLLRRGIEQVRSAPTATFTVQKLARDGLSHQLGVQWHRGKGTLVGETSFIAPPGTAAQDPASPGRRWLLAGAAAALVLLLLAMILTVGKRRRSRRLQPAHLPVVGKPQKNEPAAHIPPSFAAHQPEPLPEQALQAPLPAASRRRTQIRHELPQPAPGRPAATLKAEEGNSFGSRFAIEKDPFWIGAEESNSLRIEGDDYLSSHHACIRFVDGTLLLYDNHSTNGTFINGERMTDVPRPLGPGDRIRVGHSTFVVLAPNA